MGWSWAVFLAEAVLDDIVEDPKNPSAALWGRDKRIIEAGVLPQMTIDSPLSYTYIDDFGAMASTQSILAEDPDALKNWKDKVKRQLELTCQDLPNKQTCS